MSIRTKKKLKLYSSMILAAFMIIACAFAAVDGGYVTFAWFISRRTAGVNYASMVANSEDTVQGVKAYPYYPITDSSDPNYSLTSSVYTFSLTSVSSGDFGKYSLLNPLGNALLLEIDLTEFALNAASLNLLAHTSASAFLGETNPDGTLKQQLQRSGNSLSSIICFYSFTPSSVTKGTSYYSCALANTANTSSAKMTFVSNEVLASDVTLSTLNGGNSTLYVVVDYDAALIEYLYSMNIGNPTINAIDSAASGDGQTYLSYISDFFFYVQASEARRSV